MNWFKMGKWADSIAVVFVRCLSFFLQALPLEWALGLGRFFGTVAFHTSGRRKLAYVNLKAAFETSCDARERNAIVRRHFQHLAQNVVEMLRFPKMDQRYFDRFITAHHRERYEAARRQNRGLVLLTPHFGNWELTQILAALHGQPMTVLARAQKHNRLNDFLNELRSSHGSIAIQKGTSDVRGFIRVLQNHGMVGALGDLSGGRDGSPIRFFGRKTTAPAGVFKIAKRTGSAVLPCFMVRTKGPRHEIFIEEPFLFASNGHEECDVEKCLESYYRLLEKWIRQYPDQWLWVYKRWKHCFTKRVLFLKDGRAGHEHQSEAVQSQFEQLGNMLPRYEFEFRSVDVRFKSAWHQKLFFAFAFLFRPFAQGHLGILKFFVSRECAKALQNTHADFIISAGAGLVPMNLLLKSENLAKSVVLMRPPFPYRSDWFDLLIVPAHDQFLKDGKTVVRTLLAPNKIDDQLLRSSAEELKEVVNESSERAKRISVFVGGNTKSYRFEPRRFEKWLEELKTCAEEAGLELLITTSRRTDPKTSEMIKRIFQTHPSCKLLIIANEQNRPNAAYGMLALSDAAVVTEDSISMTSEAVGSGKHVLVMKLGNGKLSAKHVRFQETLLSHSLISVADLDHFKSELGRLNLNGPSGIRHLESKKIQEALRNLL